MGGWLSHPLTMMSTMDAIRENTSGNGGGGTIEIDCDECSQRNTVTCDDCMVTFLCGRQPGDAVLVELEEFRALRVIGDSGLIPPLRHTIDDASR